MSKTIHDYDAHELCEIECRFQWAGPKATMVDAGEEGWKTLPTSQIHIQEFTKNSDERWATITLPKWLADDRGITYDD